MKKLIATITLSLFFAAACNVIPVAQPPNTREEFPILQNPNVEAVNCMDGYVCFTTEDAKVLFIYIYTIEEAYEKAR